MEILQEQREVITSFYEYFYSKLSGFKEYEFKISKRESKSIDNFLVSISREVSLHSLGKEFWYQYFCFHFEYWRPKITRLGKNRVKFNWIIGKEAWSRWQNRYEGFMYFCEVNLCTQFEIKKSDIVPQMERVEKDYLKINELEEFLKSINYNTKESLGMCILNTTLYNDSSSLCKGCFSKLDCIKILEEKYPSIYKQRIKSK